MIYPVIDTSILVRVWCQGKPGCEIEQLRELRSLAEKKAVRLLVPEVVKLEIEKKWRSFPQDLGSKFAIVKERLEQALLDLGKQGKFWSEIHDLQKSHGEFLSDWKEQKRKACEARFNEIRALLTSKHVEV